MKCSEIQEQLSAYHDGELASELREIVAAHVADCGKCASQLAEFASYSKSFSQLPQPEAPPTVWAGIAAKLDQESGQTTVVTPRAAVRTGRPWLTVGRLALAASVLFVLGIGFWMSHHSDHFDPHHAESLSEKGSDPLRRGRKPMEIDSPPKGQTPFRIGSEFAMTMDHYLKTLANDPDGAEQFLLEKYEGQTVDPEDAIRLVGYRPAVTSGLPEEYSLASTSVMKMPCCTCVKAVCKRKDGSTLVLFEHDDEKTDWFGERRSSMATCGDKECCLVDLDSSIAATWKRGSRWVTAVGARDADEISELVTWLESKTNSQPQSLSES